MVNAGRIVQVKDSFRIAEIHARDKKCSRGYIRNMSSSRCVKRGGDLGKVVFAARKGANGSDCTGWKSRPGKINPVTNRCTTQVSLLKALADNNNAQPAKHPKWFLEHHSK